MRPEAEQAAAAPATGEMTFGQLLQSALAQVEATQVQAASQATQLAAGQTDDLARVMIASEKATLTLQLALTVRNKMLEAYQEIMRMPL